MVCIPCFIIPALLFLWHRFVQPYVLRWWNPWAVKDADGNITTPENTPFPMNCEGGVCKFSGMRKESPLETKEVATDNEENRTKAD